MGFSIQWQVLTGIVGGGSLHRWEVQLHYRKAPILEAILAFQWASPKTLNELQAVLSDSAFENFEKPKPRIQHDAAINLDAGKVSHEQKQLGYEVALRDNSEFFFLEEQQFIFVQRAPYDCWEYFSKQASSLLELVVTKLDIDTFDRVGLRFVNRIDIPVSAGEKINTDDYVTVGFDGPRKDSGIIEEFQMRVVKPAEKKGIHYALVLATTAAPMPDYISILLDIDVFTRVSVPASGKKLISVLGDMRGEKNDLFEECLTDKARELFGGVIE